MRKTEPLIRNLLSKPAKDRFTKMFQEYVKKYSRLAVEPAMRDHLKRVVKLWFMIEDLEKTLNHMNVGSKEWIKSCKVLITLNTEWSKMLTRMGCTYTSMQYIPVNERKTQPAAELIELQEKMNEFAKEKNTEIRKRINQGGARRPKDGPPINIVRKKKKKKEKN